MRSLQYIVLVIPKLCLIHKCTAHLYRHIYSQIYYLNDVIDLEEHLHAYRFHIDLRLVEDKISSLLCNTDFVLVCVKNSN